MVLSPTSAWSWHSEVHGIVHGHDLGGIDAVFVDDDVAREVADRDHAVGRLHAATLDGVHAGVHHIVGAAVERGRVHMDDERLAGQLLGGDAGQVGQPVVGVDDVVT